MHENLVPTIHRVLDDFPDCKELGFFKATIGADIMSKVSATGISNTCHTGEAAVTTSVHLSPVANFEGNICKVHTLADQERSYQVPDLKYRGFHEDSRQFFCSTITSGNVQPLQYLVAPVDSSSPWREAVGLPTKSYLDRGEQLRMTDSNIPGIYSAYEYINGDKLSPTAIHIEDGCLGSVSIMLAGAPKVWLFIPPRHQQLFEDQIKSHFAGQVRELRKGEDRNCSQFLRHLGLLVSPDLLERWGIIYHLVACEAGELIVTLPGTYHQVLNAGPNYAESVNFAVGLDWNVVPADYQFCTRQCCGEALTIEHELFIAQTNFEPFPDTPASCSSFLEAGLGSEPTKWDPTQDASESPTAKSDTQGRLTPSPHTPEYDDSRASDNVFDDTLHSSQKDTGNHLQKDLVNQHAIPPSGESGSTRKAEACTIGTHASLVEFSEGINSLPTVSKSRLDHNAGVVQGGDGRSKLEEILIPDSDSEEPSTVDLDLDNPPLVRPSTATDERISDLIREITPFAKLFKISPKSLGRLRPDTWLDDDIIMASLRLLLPDSCQPCVASQAILNFPHFGPARKEQHESEPLGRLSHHALSEHLFIVYNVRHGTLFCDENKSGNHWTLIIADIEGSRIHVFGAEPGLEEHARILASNIGSYVNRHRQEILLLSGIEWQEPNLQPVSTQSVLLIL